MRIKSIIALAVITASTIVSLISGPLAAATAKLSDLSLDDQIIAYHLSWEANDCVTGGSASGHVSDSDAAKLDFLGGSDSISGTMASGKVVGGGIDGRMSCSSAITKLLTTLKISTSDPNTYMPMFGYEQAPKSSGSCTGSDSSGCGTDGWQRTANPSGTSKSNLAAYMTYQPYFGYEDLAYTLFTSCKATVAHTGGWLPTDDRSNTQEVTIVNTDNKTSAQEVVKLPQPNNPGFSFGSAPTLAGLLVHDVSESGYRSQKDTSCMGVAEALDSSKPATALINNLPVYLTSKPTTSPSSNGTGNGSDSSSDAPACNPNLGLGWILCPVVNFLANIGDQAKSFIDSAMTVPTSTLLPLSGTANSAWGKMRDIANILFLIAFLFMIYSQLTSIGMSNYSVKKMMPKLIMVAILINASFYICVGAVEISNVVGQGVDSLISAGKCGSGDTSCIQVNSPNPDIQTSSVKGLAGLGATALAVGVVGYFFLPQVIAVIIYVAFIAMTAAIMLGIREALIVLLVVVSPLAFAAYLLPNTEGMFKKWWGLFKGLLYLYPIFGLLYGAGKLAASILGGVNGNWELQIFGYIALFAGLLALPKLLEGAMAVGGIAAIAGRVRGKATNAAQGKAQKSYDNSSFARGKALRKQNREHRSAERFAMGASGQDNSLRGRARYRASQGWRGIPGGSRLPQSKNSERDYESVNAAATAAYHKQANENVEHEMATMSAMGAEQLLDVGRDKTASAERRAAAYRRLETVGGHQHIQAAFNDLEKAGADDTDKTAEDVQQLAASSLLKRKPAGISSQKANQLGTGTLGRKEDGSAANAGDIGYYNNLKKRVNQGAFSTKDYAHMDKDDLIRLGELSQKGDLTAAHLTDIQSAVTAINADETLKGTMNKEREALFNSIISRSGPKNADGSSRARPGSSPGGLVEFK